jgi:hypothetical protein
MLYKICFSFSFFCSCNNNVTQNRAAVPEPNEAYSPQGASERPVKYIGTEFQEKKPFSKEEKAAKPINSNAYESEITTTKDSFNSKNTDVGVTKKKKGIISEGITIF